MPAALPQISSVQPSSIPLSELDDEELVRRARNGDDPAFEHLVHRYRGRLERNITNIVDGADRDDISQRTWLKIHCKLDTLREPAYFYAWANRIAVNTALAYVRKRGRRKKTSIDDLPRSKMPVDRGANAEERARWRSLFQQTRSWFEDLDPRDKKLFRYAVVDGLTMAEISEKVDLSEGGVKTRLFRAREHLRVQRDAIARKQ